MITIDILMLQLQDNVAAIKSATTTNDKQLAQMVAIQTLSKVFAPEAKTFVDSLKIKVETTQNHYGDYMNMFNGFSGLYRSGFALACKNAGGNEDGIEWALRVMNGE